MSNPHTFNIIPFSTKLAVMRTARGLTQAKLAQSVGIDQAKISQYENGLTPTPAHLDKIESFFGVTFNHPNIENALQALVNPEPIAA